MSKPVKKNEASPKRRGGTAKKPTTNVRSSVSKARKGKPSKKHSELVEVKVEEFKQKKREKKLIAGSCWSKRENLRDMIDCYVIRIKNFLKY
jgi:hypothetical protein|tara:strand:+ start:6202 stop:6477 length:276 start_codon:yes stop_codon:yes gene_type:complete